MLALIILCLWCCIIFLHILVYWFLKFVVEQNLSGVKDFTPRITGSFNGCFCPAAGCSMHVFSSSWLYNIEDWLIVIQTRSQAEHFKHSHTYSHTRTQAKLGTHLSCHGCEKWALTSCSGIVHYNKVLPNGGSPFYCGADFPVNDPLLRRCLLSSLELPVVRSMKESTHDQCCLAQPNTEKTI